MKNSEENKRRSGADVLVLLLHSLIGVVVSLLLALVAVFFVRSETLPADAIPALSSVFVFVGAFVTCFLSGRKFGKPLFIALIQSVIFLGILYITGALLYGRIAPSAPPVMIISLCITGALLGGIISAVKIKKKVR